MEASERQKNQKPKPNVVRERKGRVREERDLACAVLSRGAWLGPGALGCGSTCCLSSVTPLLGLQANLGHGGRAAGAAVRCRAFGGAGLAGLHLHPAGPGQRPPRRGEAQVPEHCARGAGWDLRGTVRLAPAQPPSACSCVPLSRTPWASGTSLYPQWCGPPTPIAQSSSPQPHLIRPHFPDLQTWASFR